jgi:uncharacterized protein (DUF58 family)
MVQAEQDYRRYLDPKVLARVSGLEMRARYIVEGFISGMHRSPLRGFSVEFSEHRKYSQGDDLRHLDWRVLGRTDKHYVKQYEQETNLQLMLVVDSSRSMTYRSAAAPLSKREYATSVAAAIAYLALRQADAVGLAAFDDRVTRVLRASNNPGQWKSVIRELESAAPARSTNIRRALDEIAEKLHRRHLVVVISDLLTEPGDLLTGLKHLRYRSHESIVLHVLDPAELEFPFSEPTRFEGLEAEGDILAQPRIVRQRYLTELRACLDQIRRGCIENRVDYALFSTRDPLDKALSGFLAGRAARLT